MNYQIDPQRLVGKRVDIRSRAATTADFDTIRAIVRDAYAQYQTMLHPTVYARYLADLLDVERHATMGKLIVAEVDGVVVGSGVFYPDASDQGLGWPQGWSGGRGLAVQPQARAFGIGRALLHCAEVLGKESGSEVFALHTAPFMRSAITLYEHAGYRRAYRYDLDLNAHFGGEGSLPVRALAYQRSLLRAVA